jgi:hypothetical protein
VEIKQKNKTMKTYDNSDWKAVANGGTVKIATQKTFRVYDSIPRGASEQISKACDAYFKKKGIVYGALGLLAKKNKEKVRPQIR